jgi:hypothetical protein
MAMVSRRQLEITLGGLWLLDGVLQFQPFMFTKEFFQGILGMADMGLPGPLSRPDVWVASLLVSHPAAWNAVFATLQILLGLGLVYRRTARAALLLSVPWALGVWVVGEGFGGLFMGGTSLIDGAPGAAFLYAVVAVLLWPDISLRTRDITGRAAWVLAWCGSALLELQTVNHAPTVPAAQIRNGGFGEPGWLAWLNTAAAHLVGHRGTEFAVGLGVTASLVGFGVCWSVSRRTALAAGMVLAAALALVGQDLGAIATGHGTDPGTGPLFVLLGLAMGSTMLAPAGTRRGVFAPSVAKTRQTKWTTIPVVPGARSMTAAGTRR